MSIREDKLKEIEHIHDGAIRNFEHFGNVCPVAFVLGEKGIGVIMPEMLKEYGDKVEFSKAVRIIAATSKADGVIFVMEAWCASQDAKKGEEEVQKAYKKYGSVKDMPDSKEVITIIEEYSDGSTYSTIHEIIRVGKGKPTLKLGDTKKLDGIGGTFSKMVGKEGIKNVIRDTLKDMVKSKQPIDGIEELFSDDDFSNNTFKKE